jgi:methylthioribulose-1-phosphate dehydratase
MQLSNSDYHALCDLVILARELNNQGHNSATSGNYSLKTSDNTFQISQSGVDKAYLTPSNFLSVDAQGKILDKLEIKGRKPSDEMKVHLGIYAKTDARCIIHAHSFAALVWTETRFNKKKPLQLKGWELLKALRGIKTHEVTVDLAVMDNTQDMDSLAQKLPDLNKNPHQWCLILRGHGIYVWGETVAEAKRHWQAYQYLFELENQLDLHAQK